MLLPRHGFVMALKPTDWWGTNTDIGEGVIEVRITAEALEDEMIPSSWIHSIRQGESGTNTYICWIKPPKEARDEITLRWPEVDLMAFDDAPEWGDELP